MSLIPVRWTSSWCTQVHADCSQLIVAPDGMCTLGTCLAWLSKLVEQYYVQSCVKPVA